MKARLLYFAWVREKAGLSEEEAEIPPGIETVGDLLRWQQGRGEAFGEAFAQIDTIRVALDQRHASHQAPIDGAREIAFFPPVTGG